MDGACETTRFNAPYRPVTSSVQKGVSGHWLPAAPNGDFNVSEVDSTSSWRTYDTGAGTYRLVNRSEYGRTMVLGDYRLNHYSL